MKLFYLAILTLAPLSSAHAYSGLMDLLAGLRSKASEPKHTEVIVSVSGAPDKSHYCEATAFGTTFAGWGATERAARLNAQENCEGKFHRMHCDTITCRLP